MGKDGMCYFCLTKCEDWIMLNENDVKKVLLQHFWLELGNNDDKQFLCTSCWITIKNFHELYIKVELTHRRQHTTASSSSSSGLLEPSELETILIKCDVPEEDIILDNYNDLNEEDDDDDDDDTDNINMVTEQTIIEIVVDNTENVNLNENEYNNSDTQQLKNKNNVDCKQLNDCINDDQNNIADKYRKVGENVVETKLKTKGADDNVLGSDNDLCSQNDDSDEEYMPKRKKSITSKKSSNSSRVQLKTPKVKVRSPSVSSSTSSCSSSSASPSNKVNKAKRKRKQSTAKKNSLSYYKEQNDKIRKYCSMQCQLCEKVFDMFAESKKHYREEHFQNGYVTCCNKKFFKFTRAVQHYEWHENPEAFKCESCKKCFMDRVSLKEHSDIHTPMEERDFKCDLCTKTYSKRFMLTSHKKLHHAKEEDKKFECKHCGQKFIVMGFLRGHIRRVHENADSRICDICAKFFKCSKAYDHHYLVQHTNTQHKVQCELCGTWLKHQMSLRDHMKRHNSYMLETCETCGKTCPNKKALRSHIRTVHHFIEYPCTICEKPFKKKQTLKEHMTKHTGEKELYTCLFCPKSFRSSANMYSHRKRAHPKEYEENRLLGKKYAD